MHSGQSLSSRLKDEGVDKTDLFKVDNISPSSQVDMAGTLWSICKQFEMDQKDIDAGGELILLATIKSKCCQIWMNMYENFKEKFSPEKCVQLVSWVLEAGDSLLLSHQYNVLSQLLQRVRSVLADQIGDIVSELSIKASKETLDTVEDVYSFYHPCLCWVKVCLLSGNARLCSGAADASLPLLVQDIVNLISHYISIPQHRLVCCLECIRIELFFVAKLVQEAEYQKAEVLLEQIRSVIPKIIQEINEHDCSIQKQLLISIERLRNKALIYIFWCDLCTGDNILAQDMPGGSPSPGKYGDIIRRALRRLYEINSFAIIDESDPNHFSKLCHDLHQALAQVGDKVICLIAWACIQLIERPGMTPFLSKYAKIFQDPNDHQGSCFILAMLRHLIHRLGRPNSYSQCQTKSEMLFAIFSNKVVVNHLQADQNLTQHCLALLWNGACDSNSQTCVVFLLQASLTLGKILQRVDIMYRCLIHLAIECENEASIQHITEAIEYDQDAWFVKLCIQFGQGEKLALSTVEETLQFLFSLKNISVSRGIFLACRALENGNQKAACLVLDKILQKAWVDHDAAFESHSMLPVILYNLFNLSVSTQHPKLLERIFSWMKVLSDDPKVLIKCCTEEDETIFSVFEYFAHESLNLSLEQIKDGNHGYATVAARFAHKIFDHLCDNRGAFMDLLASQMCSILDLHSQLVQMDPTDCSHLLAAIRERNSRLQKQCLDSYLEQVSIVSRLQDYAALVFHLKNENDSLAADIIQKYRSEMNLEKLLDVLVEIFHCPGQTHVTKQTPNLRHLGTTFKTSISMIMQIIEQRLMKNTSILSDILTLYIWTADDDAEYITLISKVHSILKGYPNGSFTDSFTFIEWLYISIWNFAISACSRENFEHASTSFTICMEGFQKWNVFNASDLAILKENSAQALGKPL